MATNKQRREAAKRKLQRQLERREQQARRRKLLTVAGAVVAVLAVAAGVTATVWYTKRDSQTTAAETSATPVAAGGQLPVFTPSPQLGADCQYPPSAFAPAKPVEPPRTGPVPTDPATISVSMVTNQGPIGLLLDNAKSPCTVNSFVSLANQGFFNDTSCHRLTTSPTLSVLQCGDPTSDPETVGSGGPGYEFANEYPTDQYGAGDPALEVPVTYPRGTLAMANSGPDTNGSQFFLVYQDSQLPPQYTVFGKIQDDGLATLDKIAAGGVAPGGRAPDDGTPNIAVTITSAQTD